MNLELPYGIKIVNPTPVDYWEGPYSSIDDALNTIPKAIRYELMSIIVLVDGIKEKYWFKGGVEDVNLVPINESFFCFKPFIEFPSIGNTKTLYIDSTTNKLYFWDDNLLIYKKQTLDADDIDIEVIDGGDSTTE